MNYKDKYIKYKLKYLNLKNIIVNNIGSGNTFGRPAIMPSASNVQNESSNISDETLENESNNNIDLTDIDFDNKINNDNNEDNESNNNVQIIQKKKPNANNIGFFNISNAKINADTSLTCSIKVDTSGKIQVDYTNFYNDVKCHLDWLYGLLVTKFTFAPSIIPKLIKRKRGILKQGETFTIREQQNYITTILLLYETYRYLNQPTQANHLVNMLRLAINDYTPSNDILPNTKDNLIYDSICQNYKNMLKLINTLRNSI